MFIVRLQRKGWIIVNYTPIFLDEIFKKILIEIKFFHSYWK